MKTKSISCIAQLGWLASIAYVLLLLAAWMCLRWSAGRHWLGTLIEFGPRWLLVLPSSLLILGAFCWSWKQWGLVVPAFLLSCALTGLCLPRWTLSSANKDDALHARILTLNTHGKADREMATMLIEEYQPQIVMLQECQHPEQWAQRLGDEWNVVHHGEFLVASRFTLSKPEPLVLDAGPNERTPAIRCRAATPAGNIVLVNVHMTTLRRGLTAVLREGPGGLQRLQAESRLRQQEGQAIADWLEAVQSPVIIAGDFNQTADNQSYEICWGEYQNAFSDVGWGWGNTFYTRRHALRIDHVLASQHWQTHVACVGPDLGSAHRPVLATVGLPEQNGIGSQTPQHVQKSVGLR